MRITFASTPQERFIAQIDALQASIDALPNTTVATILEDLAELRRQTLGEIASADGFEAFRLARLEGRLQDVMARFVEKYGTAVAGPQALMFEYGQRLAAEPLVQSGSLLHVPQLSRRQLEVVQAFQAQLISNASTETIGAISGALRLGALRGDSVAEILTTVAGSLADPGPFGSFAARAEAITRTELGRIQAIATHAGLVEAKTFVPDLQKSWAHSKNAGKWVRKGHVEADGQIRDVDEAFRVRPVKGEPYELIQYPRAANASPRNSVHCFLPGTLMRGSFVAGLKARYAGPAREIETARGHRLAVTANHPVFTARGWIAAREIHEGDDLLAYRAHADSPWRLDVNADQRPARIEDVFEALLLQGVVRRRTLPDLDLHGDAVHVDGEVDIVRTNRELWNDDHVAPLELAGDLTLEPAGLYEARASDGARMRRGGSIDARAPLMAGFGASTLRRQPQPHQTICVAIAAELDAALCESARERGPRDPGIGRELLARLPGVVAADKVVQVRDFDHQGHVFDLQSTSGALFAEGILASNCGCQSVPHRASWSDAIAAARAEQTAFEQARRAA